MDKDRIENLMEAVRSGAADELHAACEEFIRMWRDAPVGELLALKEQFRKLGLEHREAHIEEALISIAEKRPEPFTSVVTDPGHPLWRSAIEVLSMVDNQEYLDLFISLVPLCPEKDLCELVRAIGHFRCIKAVESLTDILRTADESLLLDVVLALKRCGTPETAGKIKIALDKNVPRSSDLASVVDAVIQDMECDGGGVRRDG